LRPGRIGIDATLDFCDALVMAVDHANDRDCASYEDGTDRNQQTAQTCDCVDQSHDRLRSPQGLKAPQFYPAYAALKGRSSTVALAFVQVTAALAFASATVALAFVSATVALAFASATIARVCFSHDRS